MKNITLYCAGVIFLIASIAQFLRYKLGLAIMIGNSHHIPIDFSLYISVGFLILAMWMFIAALLKNH